MNKQEIFDKLKVYDISPIHEVNGMLFKRDDLYVPFEDIPLSGGKLRQAISLVYENYDYIKDECGGKIVTGTSVTSPQGIIVARVAKEFGFESCLYVGNTKASSIVKNTLLMNVLRLGGKINYESVQAYETCLNSTIKKKRDNGDNFFQVRFGINLENDPKSILDSIGYQAQNLPKDLDYLVIPCGSCITMGGIIRGLIDYDIRPKHVIGIQIAGYDRTKTIEKIIGEDVYEYELRLSKDYPYSKHIKYQVGNIQLDPLYESKAMDYVMKYMKKEIRDKRVCFWIVGNSMAVRDKIY